MRMINIIFAAFCVAGSAFSFHPVGGLTPDTAGGEFIGTTSARFGTVAAVTNDATVLILNGTNVQTMLTNAMLKTEYATGAGEEGISVDRAQYATQAGTADRADRLGIYILPEDVVITNQLTTTITTNANEFPNGPAVSAAIVASQPASAQFHLAAFSNSPPIQTWLVFTNWNAATGGGVEMSAATGKATIQTAGWYWLFFYGWFDGLGGDASVNLAIYKNGAPVSEHNTSNAGGTITWAEYCYLAVGDVVTARYYFSWDGDPLPFVATNLFFKINYF